MNHDNDNNDDNMDEDYNSNNNEDDEEDDDDEFLGFDDDNQTYCVSSEDVRRSQSNAHNDETESSTGHHDSIDIKAYTSQIHNPNIFQWVLELAINVNNVGISNWEIQIDNSLKVKCFYYLKTELIALFERYALKTYIQWKVTLIRSILRLGVYILNTFDRDKPKERKMETIGCYDLSMMYTFVQGNKYCPIIARLELDHWRSSLNQCL